MTVLLDNKTQGKVGETLAACIGQDARLAIVSGLFSIYGYRSLKKELSKVQSLRLLLPVLKAPQETTDDNDFRLPDPSGGEQDRQFRNALNVSQVARECAEWLEQKTEIKTVTSPVPQNLFHVANPDGNSLAINGSSSFTSSGLGFTPSLAYEMNTCFTTPAETSGLLAWFESIWDNAEATRDVKAEVLSQLRELYANKSPDLLYFFTLYNIFRDVLGEIEEDKIIKTRTGIKDTLVWNKLYRFQRDGVLGAIDKIEKYNGCIIADSVGLGKTFEGLAIIKYYELRNDRVLVLCPKKLRDNWTVYTINDRRNLFADDRFNYDVLNHTDLTRVRGQSGILNLETLNWGNYDLIVIDESHNFRNNSPRKDGLTRYSRMMRDIIRSGVKTKVLMLSATPVNSRMNDLKNQVAFITEGKDDALHHCGITSLEQTLRKAQTRFNQWLRLDVSDRTAASLLETLNFDYFQLLDLLTIARSRRHVEKYYGTEEVGEFPERLKPINIKADIDASNLFSELRDVNRNIRQLNLATFAPLRYVRPDKLAEYSHKYDIRLEDGRMFRHLDREENLIHLMRVNLLKRMESSIYSFALTLERLLHGVQGILNRIEAHEDSDVEEFGIEDIETEDPEFDPYLVGNKVKVLLKDVDRIKWKQELEEDEALLVRLLREAREINPPRDDKLHKLKRLISDKCSSPINPGNKKIIIFTAFADTADYLYDNIASWVQDKHGLYSATVSGVGSNRTTMPGIRKDLAAIITSFSPISKEREKIDEKLTDEIDLQNFAPHHRTPKAHLDLDNSDDHYILSYHLHLFVDSLSPHLVVVDIANPWRK